MIRDNCGIEEEALGDVDGVAPVVTDDMIGAKAMAAK